MGFFFGLSKILQIYCSLIKFKHKQKLN